MSTSLSRSKIIQDGTSQPRAELIAALLNAHSEEVVKRSFGTHHIKHLKFTDSQIVLFWLRNEEKPLKHWVSNKVVEIRQFTELKDWYHVDGTRMIADIGTRKRTQLKYIGPESEWINGYSWMKDNVDEMLIKALDKINLNNDDIGEVNKEIPCNVPVVYVNEINLQHDEIAKRYEYSQYIIDPNRHRFEVVVRILAIVMKFISCLRNKSRCKDFKLNEYEIDKARNYFFKKGTSEVKHFNKESFYSKFCEEKDEILLYTGRILPSDEVSVVGKYTNCMLHLCNSKFCVPVLDKYSPISYSIVNYIHWNHKDVKHHGVETVWRQVLKIVFIIEGRSIIKRFRKSCQRCRYLNKKLMFLGG